jgi:carboxymethylenebutenolidase
MSISIDYYFAPQSPWTYLGHQRFVQIAKAAGATVRVMPMDLGQIFPLSGGLPLGKRAPQRQAYRLVELARFSKAMHLPLNLHPQFFPVAGDAAAKLIIAVNIHHGTEAALAITGAVLSAVWHEERDIADAATLAALLS